MVVLGAWEPKPVPWEASAHLAVRVEQPGPPMRKVKLPVPVARVASGPEKQGSAGPRKQELQEAELREAQALPTREPQESRISEQPVRAARADGQDSSRSAEWMSLAGAWGKLAAERWRARGRPLGSAWGPQAPLVEQKLWREEEE
jgi:hypothetical protein